MLTAIIKMKSTIFFVILLTSLVHISISTYSIRDFEKYLQRLGKSLAESPTDNLPFTVKKDLIKNLNETSARFKDLCIGYDVDLYKSEGNYLPVIALSKAIRKIFYHYMMRAKGNKEKVKEISAVDPIGFNVYLTLKFEDENSPTFLESIEEFHIKMQGDADVRERILATQFKKYLKRLEESIGSSSVPDMPLLLKIHLIENLVETSSHFKELCIHYDELARESSDHSEVLSLKRAINKLFYEYKESSIRHVSKLRAIQDVDPIGLNVYLTKKNVSNSSPIFIQTVEEFETTMLTRVRLFKSQTDNSQIDVYPENPDGKFFEIPEIVRQRVTTEYARFQNFTIDFFVELARARLTDITMYRLYTYLNVERYKPHTSSKVNDVQILYSTGMLPDHGPHAICIQYQAVTQNVLVYDSMMYKLLDPIQEEIVDKLYPFRKDIVFMTPKTRQDKTQTCGIFSVIYATMLLLGDDPAKTEFKLNDVHGDDTIYMRLHILNMFANRKLALMTF